MQNAQSEKNLKIFFDGNKIFLLLPRISKFRIRRCRNIIPKYSKMKKSFVVGASLCIAAIFSLVSCSKQEIEEVRVMENETIKTDLPQARSIEDSVALAELVLDLETYNSSLDSDGRSTYSAGQQTFSVEGQLMNNRSFWSFFKKIAKAVAVVSADAIGVCVGSTIHPAMGVAFCATASAGTSVLLDADINVSFLKESFGPDITRSNYGVWHNNTIAAYLNEHGSLTNLDPLQFYNYSLTYCSNNIGSSTSRPLPYEKVETLCSALAQLFTLLENDNSEKTEEEICNMIVSAVPEIRAQEVKILLNFLLKMYSPDFKVEKRREYIAGHTEVVFQSRLSEAGKKRIYDMLSVACNSSLLWKQSEK